MDGIHDTGGKHGFGKVELSDSHKIYYHEWESRVNAITSRLVAAGVYNMDEYRHAIERMTPLHYLSAPYYERIATAVATLCVEKGITTAETLDQMAGGHFPLSLPLGPGVVGPDNAPSFEVGSRVRAKNVPVSGHTRIPAYVRGKEGIVISRTPLTPFPDAEAHGLESNPQYAYDVRFKSTDLWPASSEEAWINVALFASYLELA